MKFKPLYVLAALTALSACATAPHGADRATLAQSIAGPAGMTGRIVKAGIFDLQIFERFGHDPAGPVTVYIEGDGLAWASRRTVSTDPTPTDPVALRLAAAQAQADPDAHIIYMARPCQYVRSASCSSRYWTGQRFAPEIITSYNSFLDTLPARGVNLVGFSGGGAVAALLAARRPDVLSLRTVAGNIDHRAHSALHKVTPLDGSLNPVDYAQALRNMPQIHYTGSQDTNVPAVIYDSYARALGPTNCLHHQFVAGASHEKGWTSMWPQLVAQPVQCN